MVPLMVQMQMKTDPIQVLPNLGIQYLELKPFSTLSRFSATGSNSALSQSRREEVPPITLPPLRPRSRGNLNPKATIANPAQHLGNQPHRG